MTKKISFIFGTRPEGIKLCPLILAMKEHPDFEPHVCVTAQHGGMEVSSQTQKTRSSEVNKVAGE